MHAFVHVTSPKEGHFRRTASELWPERARDRGKEGRKVRGVFKGGEEARRSAGSADERNRQQLGVIPEEGDFNLPLPREGILYAAG